MGIGGRLREERERLGANQETFGALAGVRKQAQLLYEKGERSPDAAYLAAIAAAGADVLYILTGRRSQAVPPQELLPEGDRILLDNFHHAPEGVQAGVKQTLGAFAPAPVKGRRGRAA
ncbi:helix-turn-helix domain-containing protein [Ottowia pentelensis]|uniref:Helix-turn-helix domain-containing protein n=1 Tax=Ottowia pentelensis TaxID=511108 RepID=A0ABV6PUW6_9BURK